jgi:hypothetical protein
MYEAARSSPGGGGSGCLSSGSVGMTTSEKVDIVLVYVLFYGSKLFLKLLFFFFTAVAVRFVLKQLGLLWMLPDF